MLSELTAAVRGVIHSLSESKLPTTIELTYPAYSPLAGESAGMLVLERGVHGGTSYKHHPSAVGQPPAKMAENSRAAACEDIESALSLNQGESSSVALSCPAFKPAQFDLLRNTELPDEGHAKTEVARHPAWVRWVRKIGTGEAVTLTHKDFADLLLDNREDLVEPMIAKVVSSFKTAKTVEYDADFDDVESMGLKVTWRGGSKTAQVDVPRSFQAKVPPYAVRGALVPSETLVMDVRVRVVKGEDEDGEAQPVFRLIWVNALDYEEAAALALCAKVRVACERDGVGFIRGTQVATARVFGADAAG